MYCVYALFNRKHNKIYIGQTENLEERLQLHKERSFKNSFTSKLDGDWVLFYKEELDDRRQAIAREKQLKSYRGREFVKQYIPR